MSSFLAVVAISLEVLPVLSHRLITSPYQHQQWDSIVVSSDPITIKDKTQNASLPLHPNQPLTPQKRSYECPQNDFDCLYAPPDNSARLIDKFLKQYSSPTDHNKNLSHPTPPDHSRNSYWTTHHAPPHNHPPHDNPGWVTLDPVPWSTSKISKWHPNKVAIHHQTNPWDLSPTTHRPAPQFWVSGSAHLPQRPASQWGIGTNDIITDNRPSGFPTGHLHGYGGLDRGPSQAEGGGHQGYDSKGNYPISPSHNNHPSTYPANGNGEWVLLSTTKGYSLPQRHPPFPPNPPHRLFASRKISPDISKYHEEDLRDHHPSPNRKSDHLPPSPNATQPPPHILYTATPTDAPPTTTLTRKLRLHVLPSLDSSSTSHGGLIEVDSDHQTVDEAQQEDEKLQKLKAIANVKRGKVRGFKLVPTSQLTGKGMYDRNVMTLAAVGAGMIPATMALLVPMALGRRKRSFGDGGVGEGRRG